MESSGKMRIVFTSNGFLLPNAGMTNRAVSLANSIINYNSDTLFFTFLNRRNDIDERIKIVEYMPMNLSVPTFWLLSENYGLRNLVFSRMVSKKLKEIRPDIVCVDHPPIDLYAVKARKSIGFKLVYTYHTVVDPSLYTGKFRKRMEELQTRAFHVASEADLVIAVSRFAKSQLDEMGIESTVVYNGVNTELFKPRINSSSQYKTGMPTILYVGRIMRFKGVDLLIKAFKKVKEEISEARLYIVGSKDEMESSNYWNEIQALCKNHDKSIFFLGNVCDEVLSLLYSVSDLFVCASLHEGFGMPFLEAQSCGVPCVGFYTSAIPEVVINGATGILVEKGNIDKLANAIVGLLRDSETRRRMGFCSRKFAEGFDWRIIAMQFYEKISNL
jgi:glycosyltransferase involved in cell wall biosynthesis